MMGFFQNGKDKDLYSSGLIFLTGHNRIETQRCLFYTLFLQVAYQTSFSLLNLLKPEHSRISNESPFEISSMSKFNPRLSLEIWPATMTFMWFFSASFR